MAKPLALTSGEPAGIGPDIAIEAWLRRKRGEPSAVLSARRPRPFSPIAPRHLGLRGRPRRRRRRGCLLGVRRCVARGGDRRKAATAPPGRPDAQQRGRRDGLDPPGRRRRRCGARQRRRHQPDRQERALSRRLQSSRPYRIPRRTRQSERPDAAAGDDAVVADACRRAGDDPSAAARGDRAAHQRA